ncbi:MAG: lysophospholipid acyltransferase family protein [Chloroflexi bacterium]|nr:lysophospholipid acyltransferase family protein [Chloroflexota bacterium]
MSRRFWLVVIAPVVGRLPSLFYPVASLAGRFAWRTRGRERRRLIRNLLPFCDGDAARANYHGRRAYENVGRYWVDLCTIPHRDLSTFEAGHVRIVNPDWLRTLDQPGPVIAVSAHTGNPELVVQALTHRGRPFVAIVEQLRPPAFARRMHRLRAAAGGAFYDANFAGLRASLEALQRGELLGLLGDRDIQGTGICVQIAGRPVKLPRGPWEIARRSGAVVMPMFTSRGRKDDFTLWVEEPFCVALTTDQEHDVLVAAERFAALLERHLRRDPGQWVVLEDFWEVHRCGEG